MTEEQGIQAIIDLQASVGIEEPYERAKTAWANFSKSEKETTAQIHGMMTGLNIMTAG